jgi:hypothetical protein
MDPIGSCSSTKKLGLIGLAYNCGTSSINTIGRAARWTNQGRSVWLTTTARAATTNAALYIRSCQRSQASITHPTSWRRQQRSRLTKLTRGDNGEFALTNAKHALSLLQGLPRVRIAISIRRESKMSEADGDLPTLRTKQRCNAWRGLRICWLGLAIFWFLIYSDHLHSENLMIRWRLNA